MESEKSIIDDLIYKAEIDIENKFMVNKGNVGVG